MQAVTGRFEMRLEPTELDRIDEWRGRQPNIPSRSEAVRRLLSIALTPHVETARLSAGEKLVVWMLCDLFKSLKVKSEIDPEFVQDAIIGGHLWALERNHSGLLGAQDVDRRVVTDVVNYLDMWRFIESSSAKFTKKERQSIANDSGWSHTDFRFIGFDHQDEESQYLSVARFFVEHLDTFSFLDGRDLDAHFPTLTTHRQMYAVFDPMRQKLIGRELNAEELTSILKARR